MKFNILGDEFRASLVDGLGNKNTADRYFFAVRRLLADCQFNSLAELPPEDLERRLSAVKGKSNFSAAKNGLLWLAKYDGSLQLPDSEFFKDTAKKKRNFSTRPPKTLYLDTIKRKINGLQSEKLKYGYRLMLASGLRVSEAAALTKDDIDINGDVVTVQVRHGKGDKSGTVVCMPDAYLAESLRGYMENAEEGKKLFYSAAYMRRRAGELGIECHDLRRIAAITFRQAKMKGEGETAEEANEETKDFLRHARFSTTKRYLFNRKLKFKQPQKQQVRKGISPEEPEKLQELPGADASSEEQGELTGADTSPEEQEELTDADASPEEQEEQTGADASPEEQEEQTGADASPEEQEELTSADVSPEELEEQTGPEAAPEDLEEPDTVEGPPPRTLKNIAEHVQQWEEAHSGKINLSEEEKTELLQAFSTLIDNSDFAMRISSVAILENILAEGFKNQMEVGDSGGFYSPDIRREVSRLLFGASENLEDEEYEKYGYLADKSMLSDLWDSDASSYGGIVIRFKKEKVRVTTTLTSCDSLEAYNHHDFIASPVKNLSIGSIYEPEEAYRLLQEGELDLNDAGQVACSIPQPCEGRMQYIELQYHGKLGADAIESVLFPQQYFNSQDLIPLGELRELGIEIWQEGEDGRYVSSL